MTEFRAHSNRRLPALLAAAASVLLVGAVLPRALASDPAPAEEATQQQGARERITHMADFYAGLKGMSARVDVSIEIPGIPEAGGTMSHDLAVAPPNRVALRFRDGPPSGTLVQDGEQQYVSIDPLKRYVLAPSPASFDAMGKEMDAGQIPIPAMLPLLGLLTGADNMGSFVGASETRLAGEGEIDGIACQRIELRGNGVDGEVWIADGELPWLLRFAPAAPDQDEPGANPMARIQVAFAGWKADPEDLEASFRIEPPEGFRRVEDLFEGLGGGPPPGQGPGGGIHPTVGKPAPDVALRTIDGRNVPLSDLRGKVVVLDFWATWCKPCLMALPKVQKVTSDLAEKGVVFYAVDLREAGPKVEKFLEERGLTLPVALDDGTLARAFGVGPIPHTTIIGRDGTIREVHIGFSSDLETRLRRELVELLAEGSE